MTNLETLHVRCSICGEESEQTLLVSSNTYGAPDLDLRPPEMHRSTMSTWVQECPGCGHCARRIDEAPGPQAADAVAGGPDRRMRSAPSGLIGMFLCQGLLLEHEDDFAGAGWASMYAAWVADDLGDTSEATTSRLRAADLFRRARLEGLSFARDPASECSVLADALRRAGRPQEALEECLMGLNARPEGPLLGALELEEALIAQADTSAATVPMV